MFWKYRKFGRYYIGLLGILLAVAILPIREALPIDSKAPVDSEPTVNNEAKVDSQVPSGGEANIDNKDKVDNQAKQVGPTPTAVRGGASGFLHAEGARIVDAQGNEVRISGINWFGLETSNFVPHGLWSRRWQDMLDLVAELGYNTIRLPYSNDIFDPASKPNGINFYENPDLEGLTPLEIMDKIVDGARQRGLKIILDRHRPDQSSQSNLWYTPKVSEDRWIEDWKRLARRYNGNDAVIGADLHNEPHGEATWGDGNAKTDWRLAAEKAGNAILAVNPDWLIIVEGIDTYKGDGYWWGGNLKGVTDAPVRLGTPGKLVYSAHDYGPGVYNQSWFLDSSFPSNLPSIWDSHWAFVQKQGIAPVLMGEFGGRSVGIDKEGVWQRALMKFLKERGIHYTYWSLNPNSGDTGGVLLDDWLTINKAKQAMISEYQWPLLGKK